MASKIASDDVNCRKKHVRSEPPFSGYFITRAVLDNGFDPQLLGVGSQTDEVGCVDGTAFSTGNSSRALPLIRPRRIAAYVSGHVVRAVFENGENAWVGFFDLDHAGLKAAHKLVTALWKDPPQEVLVKSRFEAPIPVPERRLLKFEVVRYHGDEATIIDEFVPLKRAPALYCGTSPSIHSFGTLIVFYFPDVERVMDFAIGFFPDTLPGFAAASALINRVLGDPLLPFKLGNSAQQWSFPVLLPYELGIYRSDDPYVAEKLMHVRCPDTWHGRYVPFVRNTSSASTPLP